MSFVSATRKEHKPVLFVFNIPNPCYAIFSAADVSQFPYEDEVLIITGNVFRVRHVVKNSNLTEIHLEHMNIKISTFKKLTHIIKAVRQRSNME